MRVLLTSAGRRVGLLRAFRQALSVYPNSAVVAGDVDPNAPALVEADDAVLLPPVRSPEYISSLIAACCEFRANIVVPLIDPELPVLADAAEMLLCHGIRAIVPERQFVEMCNDKLQTYSAFIQTGLPAPRTVLGAEAEIALSDGIIQFPLVVKPRCGSAGTGVHICKTADELRFYLKHTEDPVVQEVLTGSEVTVDVLGDGTGNVLSMVPRKRLKTRAGEVERGITIDDEVLRPLILRFAKHYRFFGPINMQCFVNGDDIRFTEVNARFGGGYPLAHAAGARFPELLIDLISGKTPTPILGQYERGLIMARFDDAFYFREHDVRSKVRHF